MGTKIVEEIALRKSEAAREAAEAKEACRKAWMAFEEDSDEELYAIEEMAVLNLEEAARMAREAFDAKWK